MKVMAYAPRSRFSGHPFSRCDFRHRRNIYRTFYGHGTDAAQRHELRAALLLRRWQADRHSLSDLRGGPDMASKTSKMPTAPTPLIRQTLPTWPISSLRFAPLNQSTAPVINLNVEIRYWVKFYS